MDSFAPQYESFLSSLSEESAQKYRYHVQKFLQYCRDQPCEISPEIVQNYITLLHQDYMTSTLWSIYAILTSYFLHSYNQDLHTLLPGLERLLKLWQKSDEIQQSEIFSRDEIDYYLLNCPNTPEYIHCKVTVILACYGLLRLHEIENLTFDQIDLQESVCFISVDRQEQQGQTKYSKLAIVDRISLQILQVYVHFFDESKRKGRFLRYFVESRGSSKNIGKNTIGKYPRQVATYLGKDPTGFTRHFWRRTAATMLAKENVSLQVLNSAGGWRNSSACERYRETSANEKINIARRFSLFENSPSDAPLPDVSNKRSRHVVNINASNNSSSIVINVFAPSHQITHENVEQLNK